MTNWKEMKKQIAIETRLKNALQRAHLEFKCDPDSAGYNAVNPQFLSLTALALGDDETIVNPRTVQLLPFDAWKIDETALNIAEGEEAVQELLNMGGEAFAEHCMEFLISSDSCEKYGFAEAYSAKKLMFS